MTSNLNILTSFSPDPSRRQRQLHCMKSWIRAGAAVYCVQPEPEARKLNFPWVTWLESTDDDAVSIECILRWSLRTPVFVGSSGYLLILNSDIELHPDALKLPLLADTIGNGILYLVRENHDPDGTNRHLDAHGIDGFFFKPESTRPFDRTNFYIGSTWWDYVLLCYYIDEGRRLYTLDHPIAFHERHSLNWSVKSWEERGMLAMHLLGFKDLHPKRLPTDALNLRETIRKATTVLSLPSIP
jgi:hypothetical protein